MGISATRPLGGPSRRSSKGGWTPEEVSRLCPCLSRPRFRPPTRPRTRPRRRGWPSRPSPWAACSDARVWRRAGVAAGAGAGVEHLKVQGAHCPVFAATGRRASPRRRVPRRQRMEEDRCASPRGAGAPLRRLSARGVPAAAGMVAAPPRDGRAATSPQPHLNHVCRHSRVLCAAVRRAVPAPLAEGAQSRPRERPLDTGGACRETCSTHAWSHERSVCGGTRRVGASAAV